MVFALGILLVSDLKHDRHVLPVLAAAILDFSDFRLHQKNFKNKNEIESLFTVVPQKYA
jgi:hypothetical protein